MFTYCYGGHEPGEPLVEWETQKPLPPPSLFVSGMILERNFSAEHTSWGAGPANAWTNHESMALAVDPRDVPAAIKFYRDEHKMKVDFNRDTGHMKIGSMAEQRKIMKAGVRGEPVVNHDSYM